MGAKPSIALRHSAFSILHSALFFDFNVKYRWVVVLAERFIGVVLSRFAVVLEEEERHLFEGDGLALLAVTLNVGFGEAFHAHHLEHHGEVEVDVEQLLFPFDADDRCGIELKILDFDLFHNVWVFRLSLRVIARRYDETIQELSAFLDCFVPRSDVMCINYAAKMQKKIRVLKKLHENCMALTCFL